jgi:hypothetical protein
LGFLGWLGTLRLEYPQRLDGGAIAVIVVAVVRLGEEELLVGKAAIAGHGRYFA